MAGIAGPPGADCGPTPGGRFGMAGIDGGAGIPRRFVGPIPCGVGGFGIAGKPAGGDCGPMPGGSPAGICGKPGGIWGEFSAAGLRRTKLRLLGKSRVNSPELRSRMSTGFGQLVAVISTHKKFVLTV